MGIRCCAAWRVGCVPLWGPGTCQPLFERGLSSCETKRPIGRTEPSGKTQEPPGCPRRNCSSSGLTVVWIRRDIGVGTAGQRGTRLAGPGSGVAGTEQDVFDGWRSFVISS
jgi:hypothetical protein